MHNRDLVWHTDSGEKIKVRNLTTSHLQNIINMLKIKKLEGYAYDTLFQELRLRKLNRLENNPDNKDLF